MGYGKIDLALVNTEDCATVLSKEPLGVGIEEFAELTLSPLDCGNIDKRLQHLRESMRVVLTSYVRQTSVCCPVERESWRHVIDKLKLVGHCLLELNSGPRFSK